MKQRSDKKCREKSWVSEQHPSDWLRHSFSSKLALALCVIHEVILQFFETGSLVTRLPAFQHLLVDSIGDVFSVVRLRQVVNFMVLPVRLVTEISRGAHAVRVDLPEAHTEAPNVQLLRDPFAHDILVRKPARKNRGNEIISQQYPEKLYARNLESRDLVQRA